MYSKKFLRRLPLNKLTDTSHIDGHISFLAGLYGESVESVPIYKRYKGYAAFSGIGRIKYVLDVIRLMFEFRFNVISPSDLNTEESNFVTEYKIIF